MARWSRIALVAVTLLTGCTTVRRLGAVDTEQLLNRAGFTRQPADAATLATMPPYKMVQKNRDGQLSYVYVDPNPCGCVYVGGRQEYSVYRRLALEQRIAADQAWAAGQGTEAP